MIGWLWKPEAAERLQRWLWLVFLLCALPLMVIVALKVPPGQAPDESAHALRAASLLHGQFVGFRGEPELKPGGWVPTARLMTDSSLVDVAARAPELHQRFDTPARARLHQVQWQQPFAASVPNTAVYPPFLYVPAAIGIGVTRALGRDPFDGFRAARLADALAYALLGALALLVARQGRAFLLALLLLPSSLWLGGTLHPDGPMIALAALSAALASRRLLWLAALALAPVIMARPPLLPLSAMLMLPLGWRRGWAPALAAALPGGLWSVLVVSPLSVPFVLPAPGLAGPLSDGNQWLGLTDPGAQIRILLAHPGLLLALPMASLQQDYEQRITEFFGVVGHLNLTLPFGLRLLGAVALGAALAGEGRGVANARLAWAGLIAFVTMLLIYDAEYINWTRPGLDHVDGVQGRYFLELVPLFALAMGRRAVPVVATLPAIALGVVNLIVIPAAVLANYK